jgi:hypothetical protein
MQEAKIVWPISSGFEVRYSSGFLYFRPRGGTAQQWEHLDRRNSLVTMSIYTVPGDE